MPKPLKNIDIHDLDWLREQIVLKGRLEAHTWDEYVSFSSEIYQYTKVLISPSTLRRFLQSDHKHLPSSTTLNAFCHYLGYDGYSDWMANGRADQSFMDLLRSLSRTYHGMEAVTLQSFSHTKGPLAWFASSLLLLPVDQWVKLLDQADAQFTEWHDRYMAGLFMALLFRKGNMGMSDLPEPVVNHPFFLERITTYFIDEERPHWYMDIVPKAALRPDKQWQLSDKRVIAFSLEHLKKRKLSDLQAQQWDELMNDWDGMSNVPRARMLGCYSMLDPDRKEHIHGILDRWFTEIPMAEQMRSSQFLIRQLEPRDWPMIREIIKPHTQQFEAMNTIKKIELSHFRDFESALDGDPGMEPVFYHLHNSAMNHFHHRRIKAALSV
ncbi:MAG: hypothetical protein ACO3GK_02240 [Bacteroidia bacterium]